MTIANFGSGEIRITDDQGHFVRLERASGNRLVMAGRMHTVAEFIEKLPSLISEPALLAAILELFEKAAGPSEKWNLKEKFARLRTLSKEFEPAHPDEVVEVIKF